MIYLLGLGAAFATYLGGLLALNREDRLHLILGFSGGAIIGVAFFDLLPEAIDLSAPAGSAAVVTTVVAAGFLAYMVLSRWILLHPHAPEDCRNSGHSGTVAASTLAIHSFFDGAAIGLAFRVSSAVGIVVAAAVLTHDFSDGINTVGVILKNHAPRATALQWLVVDACAPLVGVIVTRFIRLTPLQLGLTLGILCGFFIYIGASDLLPESHHKHPTVVTSALTVLGAVTMYVTGRLAGL